MLQRMGIEHGSNCKCCWIRAAVHSGGIQESISEVQTHVCTDPGKDLGSAKMAPQPKPQNSAGLVILNKGSKEFLMLAGLGAALPRKKKDFAMIQGAIKMMEDLTCKEGLRERSTLCLGETHPTGTLLACVCVPGNIIRAVDKSALLVARDGLDRDRFISTMVTWLLGWRGHSAWRHSGSLSKLLPWIMWMKDFVQRPEK